MDRKKTGSRILTGSLLIAIFVILWNGSTTIPVIWDTVTSVIGPIAGGIAIAFIISIPAAPVRRFLMRHIPEKPANGQYYNGNSSIHHVPGQCVYAAFSFHHSDFQFGQI